MHRLTLVLSKVGKHLIKLVDATKFVVLILWHFGKQTLKVLTSIKVVLPLLSQLVTLTMMLLAVATPALSVLGKHTLALLGVILSNQTVMLALIAMAMGGLAGWFVVDQSGLGSPFSGIFLTFFILLSPLAAVMREHSYINSLRLAGALLGIALGLLLGKVLFDLIGLEHGGFRSGATAYLAFIIAFVIFFKVR